MYIKFNLTLRLLLREKEREQMTNRKKNEEKDTHYERKVKEE